jgi:hypothetical protein
MNKKLEHSFEEIIKRKNKQVALSTVDDYLADR